MTTLTARAARRMARRALDGLLEPHLSREVDAMWPALAEDAEEAIRETLDAMREPSTAMLDAVAAGKPWIGHPEARPESVARYHEGVRKAAAGDMATMIAAFAREHGLAPPPAEEQQP